MSVFCVITFVVGMVSDATFDFLWVFAPCLLCVFIGNGISLRCPFLGVLCVLVWTHYCSGVLLGGLNWFVAEWLSFGWWWCAFFPLYMGVVLCCFGFLLIVVDLMFVLIMFSSLVVFSVLVVFFPGMYVLSSLVLSLVLVSYSF